MGIYNKKKIATLFFLLLTTIYCTIDSLDARIQSSDKIDLMVDFAYPISAMQSVRQDLNQALFFSQQNDLESVESLLQEGLSKLASRKSIEQEDREYIEAIINQIDVLINSLEKQDKSIAILDLCQQFQDRF